MRATVFARKTWFTVGILVGTLAVELVACKLQKLFRLAGGVPLTSAVEILRGDLVFTVLFGLGALFVLDRLKGLWGRVASVALHVGVLAMLLVAAMEHGFFLSTGSMGDWSVLKHGLLKLGQHWKVLGSELHGAKLALLLAPFGLIALPTALETIDPLRRWLVADAGEERAKPTAGRSWLLTGVIAGGLCLAVFLPAVKVKGEVKPLVPNIYGGLVKGVVGDLFGGDDGARWVKKGERPLFDALNLRLVPKDRPRRMNIVLVILESARARSVAPYSPGSKVMPFFSRLARRSMLIEQMNSVLPHTSKALVPMLCGFYPRITIKSVEGSVGGLPGRCLAGMLREIGYQTAFFQPATVRFEGRAQLVENMGYEVLRGHEDFLVKGFHKTNYFGYEDTVMLKPSLGWLDRAIARKRPFFLTYLTLVSHHTYSTPPSFKLERHTGSRDKDLNQYLNSLRYVDLFVERLFKEFKRRGMMKNTLFILVGDHGEAFGEHKRRQHDNIMWQEGLHVAGLLHSPKLFPKPGRIKGIRQLIDLVPTVADLLGYRISGGLLPGIPLTSPVSANRKLFFSCWYEKQCMAMRHGPLKFIYHYGRRPMELYDLARDPRERRDLASNSTKYRPRLKRVARDLLRWRARVNHVYDTANRRRINAAVSSIRPKVSSPGEVKLGKLVEFVGHDLARRFVEPGGTIDIRYVFRALRRIPKGWRLFFHLNVAQPRRFFNLDHLPVGGTYPLQRWKVGRYVTDHHRIRVPGNIPRGAILRLYIGMWKGKKRQPLVGLPGSFLSDGKRRLLVTQVRVR